MVYSITYASCVDNDLHCENCVTTKEENANIIKEKYLNDIVNNDNVSMKSKYYDSDGNEKMVFASEFGNTYILEVSVNDI